MGVGRRLGFGEVRMHLMHALFAGTTQGAFALRVRGPLDVAAFTRAVDLVRRRHAMLNAVIVQDGGEFRFASRPEDGIERVSVRRREGEDTWLRVLHDENHTPLDPGRQLWRVVVLAPAPGEEPVHDLLLIMHHAVMDAGGADTFLGQVLEEVTGTTQSEHAPLTAIPPAAESATRSAIPWERFLAAQREQAEKTRAVNPPPHLEAAPLAARRTVVAPFRLDAEHRRAADAFCADRGVSFNSYVSAALLSSVLAATPERRSFALYTAVSLRRVCDGIREDDFGCYLSVVPTFHEVPASGFDLGALAAEHHQSLQRSFLSYARPPADYPTADVLRQMEGLTALRTFANDVGFTYAESRLRTSYGPLRLEHAYVAANRSIGNVAIILHGLRLGEEVFFTLSHTAPLADSRWAAKVQRALESLVTRGPA
jgi:hypothetical protein